MLFTLEPLMTDLNLPFIYNNVKCNVLYLEYYTLKYSMLSTSVLIPHFGITNFISLKSSGCFKQCGC